MSETPGNESRPDEKTWLWPVVSGGFAISAVALWLSSICGNLVQWAFRHPAVGYIFIGLLLAAPLAALVHKVLGSLSLRREKTLPDLGSWQMVWLVQMAFLVSTIVLGLLFLVAIAVDSRFAAKVFNAVIGVLVGTALVTAISITLVRLHDLLRLIRGWR
jgi:hypothetical protein